MRRTYLRFPNYSARIGSTLCSLQELAHGVCQGEKRPGRMVTGCDGCHHAEPEPWLKSVKHNADGEAEGDRYLF